MTSQKLALLVLVLVLLLSSSSFGLAQEKQTEGRPPGILLLAHGGKNDWNEEVDKLASTVDKILPVEVAFGMANKRSIQDAIDRLVRRGVQEIVAVPLFVSSQSTVVTATQYLLGLRPDAPAELAAYAKMVHDHSAPSGTESEQTHSDPTTPVESPVPIRMTAALDRHPLVAEVLLSRAQSISQHPSHEAVVVVAHGPVSDEENARWLADMGALVGIMRRASSFKQIECLTVRDDAPEPIRSQATAELRAVVERAAQQGNKVLVVPLLISYGGIEEGIQKRLEGLSYVMSPQALLPDGRLADWVIQIAQDPDSAADSDGQLDSVRPPLDSAAAR